MSRFATRFLGALLLTCLAALPALATQYPPGPGGACPDSLTIVNIQNPAAPCHPAIGDSIYGVGGICTAFDTKTSGVGFYMQITGGGQYTGINCFTANEIPPYARGDSVVVEGGQYTKYSGDPELTSLSGSWGHMVVRYVSSGNPLPPFHDGTTNEFNHSISNVAADKWAGCLVRITGTTMRVARLPVSGSNWYVVDNVICPPGTVGPCDTVYVNGTTLPNPTFGQPPLGTLVGTIQGVWGLNTSYGPEIRIRDDKDVIAPIPPNAVDAYSVHADTIRVIFDREVTAASAQNIANYSLSSGGFVYAANLESNAKAVNLYVNNFLNPGDGESVTVSNVVAVQGLVPMPNPQTRDFYNGVIPLMTIRAPVPESLLAVPCQDRSKFSGAGSAVGGRLTFRGTCVGVLPGSLAYFEDPSRAIRSAITGYGIGSPVVGHSYLVACGTQEYFGETEAVYPAYIRDEGAVTALAPVVQTVHVLRDSTCDVSQSISNGKDYASMLVKLVGAKVTWAPSSPGGGFRVINMGTVGDTIAINNRQGLAWTYQADSLDCLNILGILRFDFGAYVVSPRSNADFITSGDVDVNPTTPSKVAFSIYPNPARTATVSFALPRRDEVDLSVFDLSGRKVATLAQGTMVAGKYTREWNGSKVPAGVYFVRLRVGAQTYNLRTISLK